jgi:hypothetical protein
MNDSEWQIPRVIILARDWNERALIAAQLQEEVLCRVESAGDLEDGLALLILRAALVILDWSDQEISADLWSKFLAAARGAPILILARQLDREELARLLIDPASILFRPFTVGDIVRRACEWLEETPNHGRTNGREQATH